ncbi:CBS domain-containing protein [Azospirillum brasilense]|nr:CBS domain-containing protein [Azospirillum brasilense]
MMPSSTELDRLLIGPDTPIMAAVKVLSQINDCILLVVDEKKILLGIVTDYDIRQALLRRVSFELPVGAIMNQRPTVVFDTASEADIADLLCKTGYAYIPVVDRNGRVVTIRFAKEFVNFARSHHENIAVVMAGGLGTRLRPLTEAQPKPLLHVGGRPILFILLDQLLNESFERIYLTLHYRPDDIIRAVRAVERYQDRVDFIIEPEPLGTAGSLGFLPVRPTKPFLVMNADLLTEVPFRELMRYHDAQGNALTMATREEAFTLPYGAVDVENGRVTAVREKPTYRMQVNIGVYVVEPRLLERLDPCRRIDMPDMIDGLIADGECVGSFPVHEYWLDIGTPDQYQRAQEDVVDLFRPATAE